MSSDGIMDYFSLYQKYATNLKNGSGNQWRGNCPFHNEKTKKNKSFCVDMDTGRYYCHSCGAKGNAITFAIHFGESTYTYHNNTNLLGRHKLEIENVFTYHKQLLDKLDNTPSFWNVKYIKLLKVCWNIDKGNFVFPIFNENNEIINVKHHQGLQFVGAKATLYPLQLLSKYDGSYIIITEGEKDVVSLLSNGLQAVTSTGGAKGIPKDISALMEFKNIYICLDNDKSGDAGTDLWIKRIKELKQKSCIRVCDLSNYVDDGGDVTDYFSVEDKSQKTFIDEIIKKSIWAKMPGSDVPDYLRNVMLSQKTKKLSARDRLVLFELIIRATRYRTVFENFNGMRVRVRPGYFVKSYPKLAKLCGKGMTTKMVIKATDKLVSLELIHKENLKRKRGMKFIIRNWNENGHSKSHSDLEKAGIQNYKFLSTEELISKLNNGHSE